MAMEGMSPMKLLFITEYLKNGNNATNAAIAAGYSEKSAYSQGSRLLKSAEVQQYLNKTEQSLNRDLRTLFVEQAQKAFEVMSDLMVNSGQDNVRYSAAKDILDRAGYKPVDKVVQDVTTRTYEEQLSELDE